MEPEADKLKDEGAITPDCSPVMYGIEQRLDVLEREALQRGAK